MENEKNTGPFGIGQRAGKLNEHTGTVGGSATLDQAARAAAAILPFRNPARAGPATERRDSMASEVDAQGFENSPGWNGWNDSKGVAPESLRGLLDWFRKRMAWLPYRLGDNRSRFVLDTLRNVNTWLLDHGHLDAPEIPERIGLADIQREIDGMLNYLTTEVNEGHGVDYCPRHPRTGLNRGQEPVDHYRELLDALKQVAGMGKLMTGRYIEADSGRRPGTHAYKVLLDFWPAWGDAQRLLAHVPDNALRDLSVLAGKPWDLATRRVLDALAEPVLFTRPWFDVSANEEPERAEVASQRQLALLEVQHNLCLKDAGSKLIFPPEYPNIEKLSVRQVMNALRQFSEWDAIASTFSAWPTLLADLNRLILDLQSIRGKRYGAQPDNAQPAAGDGQDGARTGNDKPKKPLPKMPDREAWAAYYLRQCGDGLKQEQIAQRLSKRGTEMSQATVSRKLAAVDAFLAAGGREPTPEELAAAPDPRQAVTMDPAILDIGGRQDGLTPRQRDRFDDDE